MVVRFDQDSKPDLIPGKYALQSGGNITGKYALQSGGDIYLRSYPSACHMLSMTCNICKVSMSCRKSAETQMGNNVHFTFIFSRLGDQPFFSNVLCIQYYSWNANFAWIFHGSYKTMKCRFQE